MPFARPPATRVKERRLHPEQMLIDPVYEQTDVLSLLDGLPVGVVVLDAQERVRFMNKQLEALTGFSREQAQGVPCRHVLRSGFCLHQCRSGQGHGAGQSVETDIINRHRRKIPVRLTQVTLRDRQGKALARLDVVEDLTRVKELENALSRPIGYGQIIGRSQAMENVLSILPAVAQSNSPVLITGETGTGKDVLAEAIHKASPRARESFVRVNCGHMPEALLDAELFGGRAAKPGEEPRPAKFQQAANGTIYLAEICDMPHEMQSKLVRFLDEGLVYPEGGGPGVKVNARLIAATHRSPEDLLREKALREDLFYRLNIVRLHLPPLRERGEDIGFLLHHFQEVYAARFKKNIRGFSTKALRLLLSYGYPGNVRELRNILEYAVMVCQKDLILPAHLPLLLVQSAQGEPVAVGKSVAKKKKA